MAEQLASDAPNQYKEQKNIGRVVYCKTDSLVKKAEFICHVPNFAEYMKTRTWYGTEKTGIYADFNANGITGKISLTEWASTCYLGYNVSLSVDEVSLSVFDISFKAFLYQDQNQIEVISDREVVRGIKTLGFFKYKEMKRESFALPKSDLKSAVTASVLRIVLDVRRVIPKQLKQHPGVVTCDVDKERNPAFLKAFRTGCDSDVKLVCEEKTFPVRGLVLKNVSRVFRRMLEAPMKEATTRTITIEDLTLESVQRMMDYIYGGRFNFGSDAQVVQLLYAADKYEIERLKTACLEHMVASMSDENITPFLDNSVRVNAGVEVIKQMLDYCMDRMGELRNREDFQAVALQNSKLFVENLLSR